MDLDQLIKPRHTLCVALSAFLTSRLLIFLLWASLACLQTAAPVGGVPGEATIKLDLSLAANDLRELALRNDASWYYGIALHGYEQRQFDLSEQANWAFFPLHPLLWRGALYLCSDGALVGVVIANLLFLLGLILLHRVALASGFGASVADSAVWFLSFCPTSFFFSLPWSESLFLALTAGAYLAALRRHWGIMLIAGACACACRFSGIFLVPTIFALLWPCRSELPVRAWVALAAVPIGLIAFMAVLYASSGNALAFVDIQTLWGRHFVVPYKAFGVVLIKPYVLASDWNLRPLNFFAFFAGAAGVYWLVRRRRFDLAIFLALGLLAPAFTGTLTSMARYSASLFPYALIAGNAMQDPRADRAIMMVCLSLLVVLSLAFHQQLTFAGS